MEHAINPFQQKIRIGSRPSRLAIRQVEEVVALFERERIQLKFEVVPFTTAGDQDKVTSLSMNPADDFFTDTLDSALLNGEIDLAVHSAKDLPQFLRAGLEIFALSACLDETDSLVADIKLSQMKSKAKIGTSSLIRTVGVKALNPHVQFIDIRGTIDERLELFKRHQLDGMIIATCALKRLQLEHLITEIMPWDTTPLQGQLAVVGRKADKHLKTLCTAIDVRRGYGCVQLVGAGPGDPELITMKAIKALEQTDCVFYDYLVHQDLLQYARKAEKIYVGKRKGEHSMSQAVLSKSLRQKAVAGKNVVRLKGGDPLVFGRGADEISYLRSYHIAVDVIPGVSSATGIPSSLSIPLTARGLSSSVAFISAHQEDEESPDPKLIQIPQAQTIVFFMGLTKLATITQSLLAAGWKETTPVIIISKGTTPEEKIVAGTIKTMEKLTEAQKLLPPALIIAGPTVSFWQNRAKRIHENSSEQILYLGTNPTKYQSLGRIIHWPMIEISEFPLTKKMKMQILADLEESQMIIFTSRFGVKYFMMILKEQTYPIEKLNQFDCVAIGKDTAAALKDCGVVPALISAVETSAGLLTALVQQYPLDGKKILFPRSSLPNPYLKEELLKRGAQVKEWTVYRNTKPERTGKVADLPLYGIDAVFFTSPSTVQNFIETLGEIPSNWRILSKGQHTSKALSEVGYKSEVV